jgi:hypothetical protein
MPSYLSTSQYEVKVDLKDIAPRDRLTQAMLNKKRLLSFSMA